MPDPERLQFAKELTVGMRRLPAVALMVVTGMGFGALLAALIAVQRDFRYVMYFAVQLWMFATPAVAAMAPASTTRGGFAAPQRRSVEGEAGRVPLR